MSKVCAYPDCGNELHANNRSGMCGDHRHAMGYCQCAQCRTGERQKRRDQYQRCADAGMTIFEAAREAGVTVAAVRWAAKVHGIRFEDRRHKPQSKAGVIAPPPVARADGDDILAAMRRAAAAENKRMRRIMNGGHP